MSHVLFNGKWAYCIDVVGVWSPCARNACPTLITYRPGSGHFRGEISVHVGTNKRQLNGVTRVPFNCTVWHARRDSHPRPTAESALGESDGAPSVEFARLSPSWAFSRVAKASTSSTLLMRCCRPARPCYSVSDTLSSSACPGTATGGRKNAARASSWEIRAAV